MSISTILFVVLLVDTRLERVPRGRGMIDLLLLAAVIALCFSLDAHSRNRS